MASTSWLRLASVTLIPCRTWMCFSRMSRLLNVRLPSVQYLEKGAERNGSWGGGPGGPGDAPTQTGLGDGGTDLQG